MTAQRLHSGSFLGFIESYKVIPKRKYYGSYVYFGDLGEHSLGMKF